MKVCCVCKEQKELSEFYNYKTAKDGKMYRCKVCDNIARSASRKSAGAEMTRRGYRRRVLSANFGMTLEDYDSLLEKQGGCCAICGTTNPHGEGSEATHLKNMAVDHCHNTGKVRGLLCNTCNRALGLFRDSRDVLEKALTYLENHRQSCH